MKWLCAVILVVVGSSLAEVEERPSGLKIEFVEKVDACEKEAKNGNLLTMHYTGTLEDGTKFDSSLDRSEPFKFQIGVGQVRRVINRFFARVTTLNRLSKTERQGCHFYT